MTGWRNPGVHAASVAPREDRRGLAIGLMLCAFACFTGLDTTAKLLVTAGTEPAVAAFMRYFVHLVIVAALILPRAGFSSLSSAAPRREILRAFCLFSSTLLNFTAVAYLPLTLTGTIFFTIPIFICALSVPLLGEQVGLRRWTAVAIGFVGILIVIRPWSADFHWAMLLALAASALGAVYTVLTRLLAGVDSTNTQQLYASLIAVAGLAPLAVGGWVTPEGVLPWLFFLGMGLFGWFGHQCLTTAHRYAPAAVLAPFIYTQLIYMTAASWFIFGDAPTIWILAGAPVVVASGVYIWWRERQLSET
ncbi:MAG: DMT family transporter [Pseudomonadota bacterium]